MKKATIFRIIQVCAVLIFAGRAWQHLVWDAPFRAFLWNEGLLKGFVENVIGMSWFDYVTSPKSDAVIQFLIRSTGVLYLICALIAVFYNPLKKWHRVILGIGSAGLLILALLYCKEKFFHVGQFFEYAVQIACPLFLVFWNRNWLSNQFDTILKVVLGLTFICHGLYAVGYYPQPGHFVDMVIKGFFIESEATAKDILILFGILDFVAAIFIWFKPLRSASAMYLVVWGILTALARVYTNFYIDFPWQSLNQWTWETIIRIPHGLVALPLISFSVVMKSNKLKLASS